jgi:hypothetical protein
MTLRQLRNLAFVTMMGAAVGVGFTGLEADGDCEICDNNVTGPCRDPKKGEQGYSQCNPGPTSCSVWGTPCPVVED